METRKSLLVQIWIHIVLGFEQAIFLVTQVPRFFFGQKLKENFLFFLFLKILNKITNKDFFGMELKKEQRFYLKNNNSIDLHSLPFKEC